jgi:hypothetical protein
LQQLTEATGVKLVRNVANLAALKAIVGGAGVDRELCWVEGLGLFFYDSAGATAADNVMVVQPDSGGGRWYHAAYAAKGVADGLSAYGTRVVWAGALEGSSSAALMTTGVNNGSGTVTLDIVGLPTIFTNDVVRFSGTFDIFRTAGALAGDDAKIYYKTALGDPWTQIQSITLYGKIDQGQAISFQGSFTAGGTVPTNIYIGFSAGAVAGVTVDVYGPAIYQVAVSRSV